MVAAGVEGILGMLRGNWSAMRSAHEEGWRICTRLGLERSWEASFLHMYWGLGELYAGDPQRALTVLDELGDASDDLITRALLGSYRGRALVVAGDLAPARALAAELARTPAARLGVAAIYGQVFAGELALAEHDWSRAAAIGERLARTARAQWLSVLPAISAMIDVVRAIAELGRAAAGDRTAALAARDHARGLYRRGRTSFYAVTALRVWAQAEQLLGDRARARELLGDAHAAAIARGGRIEQLAIDALSGASIDLRTASGGAARPAFAGLAIDAGPLAPAVAWLTGGVVT
jgi:hypothetical protein